MFVASFRTAAVTLAFTGTLTTAALAQEVAPLVTFTNGTKTNADDVNNNFTALRNAVNDNHLRIRALETLASFLPLNDAGTTRVNCKAILDANESKGSGLYYIRPATTTYLAHCDMTTLGGGWTLVMNVHPSDGSIVSFTNSKFWMAETEYGEIGSHFSNDYKSPAAWEVVGTNIMVAIARPGINGSLIGYKAWNMAARSYDSFFDFAINTTVTTSVIGASVANVYTYEPIIKNGTNLVVNRSINANADRIRLGVDGYSAQGDDNQPGLGTQMNEASCGVGVNCYRYRDVELWVNSNSNLWATRPTNGSYGWIGYDGGCGDSCDDAEQNKGGAYFEYWTYRIYIR